MSFDANVAYRSVIPWYCHRSSLGTYFRSYSNKEHNYTLLQAFEWYVEGGGKHWNQLAKEVPRLSEMGITAMWLPPPTKASGQVCSTRSKCWMLTLT